MWDAAVGPDASEQATLPDGGEPPYGAVSCTNAAECPGPRAACAEVTAGGKPAPCTGAGPCWCSRTCYVEYPDYGCGEGAACELAVSAPSSSGLCMPLRGGAQQGEACTQSFDGWGRAVSNPCEVGRYCVGATPENPTGTCAQLCSTNIPGLCEVLGRGEFICSPVDGGPTGFCLPRPSREAELGTPCTFDRDCDSNLCMGLTGHSGFRFCSAWCSPASTGECGATGACVEGGAGGICFPACSQGGTAYCANIHPDTTCHRIRASEFSGLCLPACRMDSDCPLEGWTCDTSTGECF